MSKFVLVIILILCSRAITLDTNVSINNPVVISSTKSPFYLRPNTVNVNTVLFKDSDVSKICWNADDVILLAIRREMQELIPTKMPENVTKLFDYYKLLLEAVDSLETDDGDGGQRRKLIVSAFADSIGGHLNFLGIPATNAGYYTGDVEYEEARNMHDLFDTVKEYLATSGRDWRTPIPSPIVPGTVPVRPLELRFPLRQDPCRELVLRPGAKVDGGTADLLPIPMPYLDDENHPNSIALPFRFRSLFSLGNGNTSNVLLRYYELGLGCLARSYRPKDVASFNANVSSWIFKSVLPHLRGTKWYPGFKGVARIIETARLVDSGEIQLPSSNTTPMTHWEDSRDRLWNRGNLNASLTTKTDGAMLRMRSAAPDWFLRELEKCAHFSGRFAKFSLSRDAAVGIVLCFLVLLLLPCYIRHLRRRKTARTRRLRTRESETKLFRKLLVLSPQEGGAGKKRNSGLVHTERSDDEEVHSKFTFFKNFWREKRTLPTHSERSLSLLDRERRNHNDGPSCATLPTDDCERLYRSE
ncbi:unnamed protein product [Bemisia tabaci]|uniref:Uncharacterized protein n=1 Tax=Bemisia tabaci TaxID=7038 RepID=A0A9P0A591_BEMTA|nr:unnamed protein product [Bemisia tabaci]